jgi:hypothetical protein
MGVISELPRFPKFDRRLLGAWKSDRKRTFEEWSWRKKLPPQKKKRFTACFGNLEINYTRTKIIMTLRYRKWEQARRYQVVASDESSVAIVQFGPMKIKNRSKYDPEHLKLMQKMFPPKPVIQHIHFEKEHFWISLGNGKNREFFWKIHPRMAGAIA